MNCELLSIIKPSEPLQCTRIELHSCYSVVTGCVVQQLKLKAILEMVHQILVLQNSSEDPASHPSLDQGRMGLRCCSCHNLAAVGGRERLGDVSVVLIFSPAHFGGQGRNFNRKHKKSEVFWRHYHREPRKGGSHRIEAKSDSYYSH